MITDQERIDLIKYRLEQAEKTYVAVESLIQTDNLPAAVNRIYYGMFYGLLALAVKNSYKTSKHQQLLGWFNKNFINTQVIEKKYGKFIQDAFENRMEGDYEPYIEFDKETIEQMYADMRLFLDRMRREIETP